MTRIYILAFAGIGVIAVLDYWTGHEISFSVFYLLPVGLLAWRTRLCASLGAAVLSAVLWYSADVSSHDHSHPIIGVWNATARLIIFVFAGLVLHRVQALLDRELSRSQRTGRAFTLAYLDLDRFKAVNDRFGHAAEDLVLRDVGMKLAITVRGIDATARLGGDEFALLLSETDAAPAKAALERIQKTLSLTLRSIRAASEVGITASIGAVVYSGGTASSDDLLAAADALMYRTKHQGPGSILIESPEAWRAGAMLSHSATRSEP